MRRTLSLVVSALILLGGCRAKEAMDKAKIASDLDKHGTMDLMKDVADDKYDAPKDGKLTDSQIQMYLKVREHEKQIAQVAKQQLQQHAEESKKNGEKSLGGMVEGFKALGSAADFATADIRAAKDLKYNTQEYLWVKSQVLSASSSAMAEKMGEAMNAQMNASYAQMKKSMDEAPDATTKKMYADMLAGFDKQKTEAAAQKQQEDPALAYNRQLLSKYEGALNAFTQEMSKYEDKPGEVQKGMEQWQNDIDKAKADAGKQH
jgi:hypothetical protein